MAQIALPLATKQTLNAAMERLFRSVGLPENSLGFDFAAQIDANSSNTTFTSTAANGVDAFNVTTNGARFHLGTGTSDYMYSDGTYLYSQTRINAPSFASPSGVFYGNVFNTYSNAAMQSISQVPDSASSVAFLFNNNVTLTSVGAKLVSFQNNTVEKVYIDKDGSLTTSGNIISSGAGIFTSLNSPNTAAPVSLLSTRPAADTGNDVIINTNNARTAGKLLSIQSAGAEKVAIDVNGKLVIPTGGAAAVTGSATLVAGVVTVNTTSVTASSKIFMEHEGTGVVANFGTLYKGTVVAGTSFQIKSTNASDTDSISWFIIN